MANSDHSSSYLMSLSGGNKELWSNVSEGAGTNAAITYKSESEKLSGTIIGNREDSNLDSACKTSPSVDKKADHAIGNKSVAQALFQINNTEEDINVQATFNGDGEKNATLTSNADFEGVSLEDENGMNRRDQESMSLMNTNGSVAFTVLRNSDIIINWYNYIAKVRQLFKEFGVDR